ncbi:branched-chain amino acid ABC transporter permease [Heliobacterium gestii]|uniref:Branched-chain amino acid ABC transporter permease n=1 Tax=Heliomicrobium gestii TaxID=2699 RepID=A0A845LD02_HELGE|nr:AzlC family ABC transporter permease [Heliomicrobium gestii]MBM7866932.1 4-azaleucine resistance transporter AzlC [Heliomicrobium gestii]MZP42355.1 branched-chain amino acid ABC transporter permease [Heliomicrobium gestii]
MDTEKTVALGQVVLSAGELGLAVRDTLPILVGIIPFGITCGIMGPTAGLSPMETVMMSALVFAGASQFVAMSMIGAGITGWGVIVLTTLLVNLRHLLMGASLAPHMSRLPLPMQALLSFGLVDESYAVTVGRMLHKGYSATYQLGASATMYLTWLGSTAAGVMLGSRFPDPLAWGLDFAMAATFLVLLIPRLTDPIQRKVCATAAVMALLGASLLPGKWYIIVACLTASAAGAYLEGRKTSAQ